MKARLLEPDSPTVINLRRLVLLRNIAIASAVVGVFIASQHFHISTPFLPLATIISSLGLLNFLTWRRLQKACTVTEQEFFVQMIFDVAALTGILYFTGGAINPFAVFYLLPLTIAATVLRRSYTWVMAGLTALCYTFLMATHMHFVGIPVHSGQDTFALHIFGMWLGFVLIAGLIAYFVVSMGETLRQRDTALAKAREQALRDERLIALGTLAAGAAHELGTPLGTMAILTKELASDYSEEKFSDLHCRLKVLRAQVDRCKDALSVISASAGAVRAEGGHLMRLGDYLADVVSRLQEQRPNIELKLRLVGPKPPPSIVAERTLTQALVNILNNAADASPEHIEVDARWTDSALLVEVKDRGEGLSTAVSHPSEALGLSTKKEGLGLGLFLSHAAITRLGGTISLHNRKNGGIRTHVQVPLAQLRPEVAL